jgi:Flp pilus assembly protein TadB
MKKPVKPILGDSHLEDAKPLLYGMGAIVVVVGFVALVFAMQGSTDVRSWAKERKENKQAKTLQEANTRKKDAEKRQAEEERQRRLRKEAQEKKNKRCAPCVTNPNSEACKKADCTIQVGQELQQGTGGTLQEE